MKRVLLFVALLLFRHEAACLAAPGDLDATFGTGGKVTTPIGPITDEGRSVAVQNDGKIVVAGISFNNGNSDFALARYMPSGALDTSFGTGGKVTTPIGLNIDRGESVALQADGKIVVAGFFTKDGHEDFALVRYTVNGALDTTFGIGGKVTTSIRGIADNAHSVKLQSDGKIVVAGHSYNSSAFNEDFAVARYTASGALDLTFGIGGKVFTPIGNTYDFGYSAAVQDDGKIVVAGYSANGSNYDIALARYTASGGLDTGFGTGGKVITPIGSGDDYGYSVAVQSDGKIVVAGYSYNGSNNDIALVRYTSTGALDTGFGTGGKVTTPVGGGLSEDLGRSVVLQSDGKIVVAGQSDNGGGYKFALVRYTASGALDTGFGTGGKVTTSIGLLESYGHSVAVQSDGKLVVAGWSYNAAADTDFALARYLGDPPDNDSDGLLDSWEITHFGGITAHSALDDTDGDGRVELIEEAFGTDPLVPEIGPILQPFAESDYLTMSLTRRTGVTYTIQSAGSPDGPAFSAATTTVLVDDGTTLKVRDNFPIASTPQRYLRVLVIAAP